MMKNVVHQVQGEKLLVPVAETLHLHAKFVRDRTSLCPVLEDPILSGLHHQPPPPSHTGQ
jgi:hypothetical protein